MGCDIHMVLERKFENRWVGMHSFDYTTDYKYENDEPKDRIYGGWLVRNRNYNLFASLAGVRGNGPEPRGLPDDLSDLARLQLGYWGEDGHSQTWYSMPEALPIFAAHYMPGHLLTEKRHNLAYTLFDIEDEDVELYRLIIWFDN